MKAFDSQRQSAILLLAHGTPNALGEMAEYLSKVTGGRALPEAVVHELQHRYAQIGLGETPGPEPPHLTKWTLRQRELLERELDTPVFVGMRNWHPFIAETVAQMRSDGVTHARVLCLAPFSALGPGTIPLRRHASCGPSCPGHQVRRAIERTGVIAHGPALPDRPGETDFVAAGCGSEAGRGRMSR